MTKPINYNFNNDSPHTVIEHWQCVFCGVPMTVEFAAHQWAEYFDHNNPTRRGRHHRPYAQDVFRHLTPEQRDVIITRLCIPCQP